jgi:DNA-binding response OmpR family regulator
MFKSLIIEDDPQIAELIAIHLHDLNFDVTSKLNGLEGHKTAIR